ncbi:hypothetical protein PHISP_02563 [Aspergillus sp. HF37]|nr:hypothetical protein PHISP_02563 [Aspergillus sp. HF37]
MDLCRRLICELRDDRALLRDELDRAKQMNHFLTQENRRFRFQRNQALKKTRDCGEALQQLDLDKLRAEERARRQQELLDKARAEALEIKTEKFEIQSCLTQQLHSVQMRHDILDDDEVERIFLSLYGRLEGFVRKNFNHSEILEWMTPESLREMDLELPEGMDDFHSVQQLQAFIQGGMAMLIFAFVFSRMLFGHDRILEAIAGQVHKLCPNHVSGHWRTATSIAIESLIGDNAQEATCKSLIAVTESLFSHYSVTEETGRKDQMHELFEQCEQFKRRLERQEFRYHFRYSDPGTDYDSATMLSITGEEDPDFAVLFSPWPALWRDADDSKRLMVAREQVWVRKDNPGRPMARSATSDETLFCSSMDVGYA